jgi:hypothetical protein
MQPNMLSGNTIGIEAVWWKFDKVPARHIPKYQMEYSELFSTTTYGKIAFNAFLLFITDNFWTFSSNRKLFFKEFAKSRGFDPLIPENWHHITRYDIVVFKV